jgi:hypothetical protein
MILSVYSIPITITVMTYGRVVKFMKKSSLHNQQHRYATIVRDVMVLQRIVILVGILIVLGLPSAILWIQGLVTGHLHPLTYRIQSIFIAVTMFTLAIAVALINPQVKRLIPLLNKHNTIHAMIVQH